MSKKGFIFRLLLCLSIFCFIPACTKSSSDADGGSDEDDIIRSNEFRSDCGTVVEGVLANPVSTDNGRFGSVRAVAANLLIMSSGGGDQLIKLQGIGEPKFSFQKQGAIDLLNSLVSGGAYFFPAGTTCSVSTSGGGQGVAGQVFTSSGVNVGERLLREGLAVVTRNDNCRGSLLDSCYTALADSAGGTIGGVVSQFLWKPNSDSDGNLVITFSPAAESVVVQGESLRSVGAGNGRASTFRASRPGCSYGNNVTVFITDSDGNRIVAPGGNNVVVPTGCARFEIQ
jgi:hypothetical protein